MLSNSGTSLGGFLRPVVLTPEETKRVAGGMVHKNDKNGVGPNPNQYGPPGGNPSDPNPVGPHDE
jgi:hypothetical protein